MCMGLECEAVLRARRLQGGSNIGCRLWCECAAVLGGRKVFHAKNAKPLDLRKIQGLCVIRYGGKVGI